MNLSTLLGNELHKRRVELNLTQEQMAEMCGLSPRHYSDLENGKINPRFDTALRLSAACNFSIDALKEKINLE